MDLSLFKRAVRALLAGSLLLASSLAPAFPHSFSAPGPRASMAHWGGAHGQRVFGGRGHFLADRGTAFARGWIWGRKGWGWNGWAHDRFAHYGWSRGGWRGRNGWNGGFGYDSGYGAAYWDGYGEPAAVAGGANPLVFAPSLTVYAPSAPNRGEEAVAGGCVIHKLEYDSAGNYVGEKQYSGC